MKDNMHNRILSGETTERDAIKFRIIQVAFILLGISLIISWVIK